MSRDEMGSSLLQWNFEEEEKITLAVDTTRERYLIVIERDV